MILPYVNNPDMKIERAKSVARFLHYNNIEFEGETQPSFGNTAIVIMGGVKVGITYEEPRVTFRFGVNGEQVNIYTNGNTSPKMNQFLSRAIKDQIKENIK